MRYAIEMICVASIISYIFLIIIFGSDANSIRNLCGPAGMRVYVCMYVCVRTAAVLGGQWTIEISRTMCPHKKYDNRNNGTMCPHK